MGFITNSSELLADLNITSTADQNKADALIAVADQFITTYCNRQFNFNTYDKVFQIKADGVIFLDAYPVQTVLRVVLDRISAMTISCTSAVASFSTGVDTSDVVHLYLYDPTTSSTPIDLSSATFATLSSLATAVGTHAGWSATVQTGYDAHPSSDLLPGLTSVATGGGGQLQIWSDQGTAQYGVDLENGYIRALIGAQWFTAGFDLWGGNQFGNDLGTGNVATDWIFGTGAWQPYGYWSDMYRKARIVWQGGYSTIPQDLCQVEAAIVKSLWNDKNLLLTSEKIGYVEYTKALINLDRVPMTERRILDSYRNRSV